MKSKNENRYEDFASFFHEKANLPKEESTSQDFKVVDKIYSLREKIVLLAKLKTAESVWKKLDHRIIENRQTLKIRKLFRFPYAAALLLLLVVAGTLGVVNYLSPFSDRQLSYSEIISYTGEMKEVELPDGTNVWLGSNSSLKYDNKFGQRNRFVDLNGEAMFDVTTDNTLPFYVNMGKASIKVHGTKFLVTSYAEGHNNEVILMEGKVEYLRQNHSYTLVPGESLADNLHTDKIIKKKIELDSYSQWRDGKVYLDNNNLDYLVFLMGQWYGKKFVFRDTNLKELTFTGVINKNNSLDYNINIIELTNKVKFEKSENLITIIEQK